DDELIKMILKEHQVEAIEKVVNRAAEKDKNTGLIWHTQGSGKTLTMITAASKLIKDPRFEKPTVILLIDRNELEDQLMKNLESLGITDIYQAQSKKELRDLLKSDTRGLIVSMVHKFEDAPEKLNTRSNIFVLVDEAHRTTSGDLGTYLQAAVPNATFFGFTGTPIDKIHYGQGTFKVFGKDDEQGYLDKYSIAESIKDGTTVPLNYALSPNEFLVPKRILEEEFLSLAETEGINDIEQLNKVLERAVNTKSFLKSRERIAKVTKYIAEHYKNNVEPLGYKAFLVGVDRESCALYKEELDKILPENYSKVVYTSAHNDDQFLKKYYMSEDEEKKIRKEFPKADTLPKILIVTEKLLTGFDAPCLYAMYLDKPMRDHTLLQAIARVNRPYEDKQGIKKPYGFVLDFVGIFGNLEKALSFDSDTVKSVITDIDKLKDKFKELIETVGNVYLATFGNKRVLNDKDIEKIIESFRDEEKRKSFLDFYKELETLYEILSPDIFLRPYIDSFQSLSEIAFVIKNAYTQRVFIEKDFLNKTESLVRDRVTSEIFGKITKTYKINEETLTKIKKENDSEDVKVINLIKSIKKHSIDKEDKEKYLISISERADGIREAFEKQQLTTQKTLLALEELVEEVNKSEQMKKDKGFDDQTFFIYSLLKEIFEEYDLVDFEVTAREINELFVKYPYHASNSKQKRELGADIYALLLKTEENKVKETNDIFPKVNKFVERLFDLLND
ncbi:MAG TPA: HsdR family type I site-specific deoxyribonuclease, partial [bacterium]|nr:HsdR family type I site-specific deoxyribonuclease [bacterium]